MTIKYSGEVTELSRMNDKVDSITFTFYQEDTPTSGDRFTISDTVKAGAFSLRDKVLLSIETQ